MSPGADSAPSQRIAAPPSALAAGAPGLRRARSRLHDVLNAPAATPAPRGGLARAAAVVTATVLGIVIQYIYFHVDLLARQFAYRPALEQFCALLPCTVPPLRDLSRIRAQNLLVRTHPTVANALQLDALLVNEAPFAQPFPRLLLMFQDLQGAVVARRHYTPAEYQGGELAGATTMPAQRSVRLRLEFLDPGESAVSYSLDPLD